GRIFPSSELTLDHVVPRSRGGRSSWENLVACCYQCNNSKGDRTPEEAGLKLARRPRPFTLHTSRQLMRLIGHRDERWRKYLFYREFPRARRYFLHVENFFSDAQPFPPPRI